MRVAHIITRLIIGGAQENTLASVDDLHHRHGDDVCLITGPGLGPEGTLERRARDRGLDLRVLPELRRNLHPWQDIRAWRRLKQLLREFKPDIVHTHSSKAGILGRHAASSLGLPAIHTIHGASFHFGQPRLLFAAYRMAERRADRWCRHFISVCDAMTAQYLAAGIGTADKFTTIYSGMDVDTFLQPAIPREEMRRRLGLADTDVVVGKIARLFPLKGHEYLLQAAPEIVRRNPSVRFLLVGDGILQDSFRASISELGIADRFVMPGLVAPEDVTNYLHAMDIVMHTSVWEGLARVLPQALIAGRPVVSFDIDGAREVCLDGITGALVPARDCGRLAEAITHLAADPELRARMGQEGRKRFAEQFRHEYMTQRIRDVYHKVLDPISPAQENHG